jgi:molecular chaperone HtpG
MAAPNNQPIPFRAETRQLLNILVHSLYTEREIFLRELISNASDALTRLNYEMLTQREVLDPSLELAIHITVNPEDRTLIVSDTGVGMTADELIENLGTIAHSGARAFIDAASQGENLSEIIGQFGVGFYSAFMVAEWIRVETRSYHPDASAAAWYSDGSDEFSIESSDKTQRGTDVIIKVNEEALEFVEESRLREVIKRHSDFVAYPIFLGDSQEQVNRQSAIWRQQPRQVEEKEYDAFYQQLTLDFEPPLTHAHMVVDAPVQMYTMLFIPTNPEQKIFSLRKQPGLKLYSRKVLIQEYCQDLLPEYLQFVQGVVDTEDLPLNVSRESIQANKIMLNLKKLVTNKVLDTLEELSNKNPENYYKFWEAYSRYIKQGIAIETGDTDPLNALVRFHTTAHSDEWSSFQDYISRMKPEQKEIYYILADNQRSALHSPHLDQVYKQSYEVILFTDPLDAFMLVRLTKYEDYPLKNVASIELEPALEDSQEAQEAVPVEHYTNLIQRFKEKLGERVGDVRITQSLVNSPSRLVDHEGAPQQELQRVYRLIQQDYEVPKKVLELNPKHTIIMQLNDLPENNPLSGIIVEQIYENALLLEGLHPDPASMIERIQSLMQAALTTHAVD